MISLGAGSILTGAASASELSRQVAGDMPTVRDRHNGLGYRAGQFWILPTLETGILFDDNVFATSSGERSDAAWYVTPNVAIKSKFGRHALNVNLVANHYEYFDYSSQSRTDFHGDMDGRVEVSSDLVLLGGLKGGLRDQTIWDLEYPLGEVDPGRYYDFGAWGSINKAFNRLSVSIGGAYGFKTYEDVDGLDQSFRDSDEKAVEGRIAYLVSPGYRVYGDFRYNWRDYDGTEIGNSEGWRATGGVMFEITHLVSGEVGIGYMEQDYVGAGTASGWTYHAGLVWNPTPLMTVNLDADRTVEDTYLDADGRIQDMLSLSLDYEVSRRLVLSPSIAFAYNDYETQAFDDWRNHAGLQADYEVNRFLSVGGRYVYTYSDFTAPGYAEAGRHLVGLYAKARF